ncbi:MAG: SlyX family protein [Pseudomonadota bacterium]
MDEQRIVEIETKLAHQELTLEELNAVVTEQDSRLMRLEELTERLLDRVQSLSDAGASTAVGDERPPHY